MHSQCIHSYIKLLPRSAPASCRHKVAPQRPPQANFTAIHTYIQTHTYKVASQRRPQPRKVAPQSLPRATLHTPIHTHTHIQLLPKGAPSLAKLLPRGLPRATLHTATIFVPRGAPRLLHTYIRTYTHCSPKVPQGSPRLPTCVHTYTHNGAC